MSTIPTAEILKDKAKVIRKFMKEKCNVDVSHGHCIELISQLFGFKDWNTASATLKSKADQNIFPAQIKTVGDMKRALEACDDSASIDADYDFKLGDFLDEIDPLAHREDVINQEFSFILEQGAKDIVSFTMVLEHESMTTFS